MQLRAGTSLSEGRALVRSVGGKVSRELSIINGLGAVVSPAAADALERDSRVRAVSANAPVQSTANSITSPSLLRTSFNQSVRADKAWSKGATGSGVGVAVVDTGHRRRASGLPEVGHRHRSRVIASVVVNPNARNAGDAYGHGTHVAGLIAGNGNNRSYWDSLDGDYVGHGPGRQPDLDQDRGRERQREPHRRHRRHPVRRRAQGGLQHPRPQPVAQLVGRRVVQDRPARRGGRGGLVQRDRRRHGSGQRRHRRRRGLVRARERSVRDHGGRRGRPGHGLDRRRSAGELVEPRHDPGRPPQARDPRSGVPARVDDVTRGARTPRCAPPAWSAPSTCSSAARRCPPLSCRASWPTSSRTGRHGRRTRSRAP